MRSYQATLRLFILNSNKTRTPYNSEIQDIKPTYEFEMKVCSTFGWNGNMIATSRYSVQIFNQGSASDSGAGTLAVSSIRLISLFLPLNLRLSDLLRYWAEHTSSTTSQLRAGVTASVTDDDSSTMTLSPQTSSQSFSSSGSGFRVATWPFAILGLFIVAAVFLCCILPGCRCRNQRNVAAQNEPLGLFEPPSNALGLREVYASPSGGYPMPSIEVNAPVGLKSIDRRD